MTNRSTAARPSVHIPPDILPAPRRFATLEAGAEYLSISVTSMRRYISSGRVTAYRLGERLLRVDLAELDAVMRPVSAGGDDHA